MRRCSASSRTRKRSTKSTGERRRRLFVGIALDDAVRAEAVAAARKLEAAGLSAKFETPEKLHVTLAFLGSVDSERVTELIAALRDALDGVPAFDVRFDTLGGFPNRRQARIAWIGAQREDANFAQLAARVRDASRHFAALDEKKPVLHVTLARIREPAPLPRVAVSARTMRIDEVVLFESLPGEGTSRYEVVERFALTVQASSPDASR